jgi:molybdopterin-guanine dinucleotide biosynthesis protein A
MTSERILEPPLFGLFVGGKARRFGGIAKGWLETPDGSSIVERTLAITRAAIPEASWVLVGEAAAYERLGLEAIADAPPGIGPLGGLSALLQEAERRGARTALALACDMPFLSTGLIRKLCELEPRAPVLAPRPPGQPWYALTARYATAVLPVFRTMIAEGEHKLQRLFERVPGATALELSEGELTALVDWDSAEDLRR